MSIIIAKNDDLEHELMLVTRALELRDQCQNSDIKKLEAKIKQLEDENE